MHALWSRMARPNLRGGGSVFGGDTLRYDIVTSFSLMHFLCFMLSLCNRYTFAHRWLVQGWSPRHLLLSATGIALEIGRGKGWPKPYIVECVRNVGLGRLACPKSMQRAPFPALHTTETTFHASDSSNRTHNRGNSEITFSICRCSGTRGRDPQCAWYHRNFLFSQCPILVRHSSGPFGGIFEIGSKYTFTLTESQSLKSVCFYSLRLRWKVHITWYDCTFANGRAKL